MIVWIDNGITHNFIHWWVVEEHDFYVHVVHKFQIMIANAGMMKCGGKCENVKLQMGDYQFKSHMFDIEMVSSDVVHLVEWLRTLGLITMDSKELYMSFIMEGHWYTLKGIKSDALEMINSHYMEKILKKCHFSIISQFNSIQVLLNSPWFTIGPD